MRIAIFDYRVTAKNPSGGCHLALVRTLAGEHEFTVFSTEFENPAPDRIEWVRVPVPKRPLAVLFVSFHMIAPVLYIWHRLRTGKVFDVVQSVESNLGFGDLVYAHFSHRTYLKKRQTDGSGVRGWLRRLDHALHALVEPWRLRRAKLIVVPSSGLKQEIRTEFDLAEAKIEVVANPVHTQKLERPATFDRDGFRASLDMAPSDVVCVFCALGHFDRKGLPLLLEALRRPQLHAIKLVVVGGEDDLVKAYKTRASAMGVGPKLRFTGIQKDTRPYLWSAEAFVLPSQYETFSLAAYEAAAAGLPILAPALHGICDLLIDGETGFVVEPTVHSVAEALERLMKTPADERVRIGRRAREAASHFSVERFTENWRSVYRRRFSHASELAGIVEKPVSTVL